jgi:hypothetical protein
MALNPPEQQIYSFFVKSFKLKTFLDTKPDLNVTKAAASSAAGNLEKKRTEINVFQK